MSILLIFHNDNDDSDHNNHDDNDNDNDNNNHTKMLEDNGQESRLVHVAKPWEVAKDHSISVIILRIFKE